MVCYAMNIFKPLTFKWWEVSLFKLSMVAFGIVIGAAWPGVFSPLIPYLLVLFAVPALYLTWVWWKQ